MTDDMSMEAMAQYETPYTKAVLAGNDMVIVTDFEAAYNEVLGAVTDGTIPESTIDAAVERLSLIHILQSCRTVLCFLQRLPPPAPRMCLLLPFPQALPPRP